MTGRPLGSMLVALSLLTAACDDRRPDAVITVTNNSESQVSVWACRGQCGVSLGCGGLCPADGGLDGALPVPGDDIQPDPRCSARVETIPSKGETEVAIYVNAGDRDRFFLRYICSCKSHQTQGDVFYEVVRAVNVDLNGVERPARIAMTLDCFSPAKCTHVETPVTCRE